MQGKSWILVRDRAELWVIGQALARSVFRYRLMLTNMNGRTWARTEVVS